MLSLFHPLTSLNLCYHQTLIVADTHFHMASILPYPTWALRVIFLLFTFFSLSTTALPTSEKEHQHYAYGPNKSIAVRQVSSSFNSVVTGAQGGSGSDGSVPLRREVREMETDDKTWTLYILGLDMMQYTDQDYPYSWYQITGRLARYLLFASICSQVCLGIHGRPFVPWNNVQSGAGDSDNGYCNHVSVLFPTWHRPYLALFEVRIFIFTLHDSISDSS